jgi:hypothetical protein
MYQVQVGKDESKYKTKLTTNNEAQAYHVYSGYNVHSGWKKRLLEDGKVIERMVTYRYG